MEHSTPDAIDLDAYFDRIGYQGDRSPTLKTLQSIHFHHATVIPFENLNSFLKQPVLLDLASLQHKLIHQRRGGYCFEQNLLLRSVLFTLGFQVTNLAARVLWNIPTDTVTPRSHMLLRIEIENTSYIADVGFGGLTLTAPLVLEPDIQQNTPHEAFRFIVDNQTYIMQAWVAQEWKSLYRFDLQVQQLPDYQVSNWYVSTYPNSPFVTSLIAARPASDCRYALRNNQLVTHYLNGHAEQRILKTVTEMRSALEHLFKLQLPALLDLDTALQRLTENPE